MESPFSLTKSNKGCLGDGDGPNPSAILLHFYFLDSLIFQTTMKCVSRNEMCKEVSPVLLC